VFNLKITDQTQYGTRAHRRRRRIRIFSRPTSFAAQWTWRVGDRSPRRTTRFPPNCRKIRLLYRQRGGGGGGGRHDFRRKRPTGRVSVTSTVHSTESKTSRAFRCVSQRGRVRPATNERPRPRNVFEPVRRTRKILDFNLSSRSLSLRFYHSLVFFIVVRPVRSAPYVRVCRSINFFLQPNVRRVAVSRLNTHRPEQQRTMYSVWSRYRRHVYRNAVSQFSHRTTIDGPKQYVKCALPVANGPSDRTATDSDCTLLKRTDVIS